MEGLLQAAVCSLSLISSLSLILFFVSVACIVFIVKLENASEKGFYAKTLKTFCFTGHPRRVFFFTVCEVLSDCISTMASGLLD